jgi:hypothetical protein
MGSRRLSRTKSRQKKAQRQEKLHLQRPKTIRRDKDAIARAEKTNTVHHRRPLSLNGSKDKSNTSRISEEIHNAWTILVGNMNAEQIANYFNIIIKPRGKTFVCIFINGSRCMRVGSPGTSDPVKMQYALKVLFKGYRNMDEKLKYVNNVLLDPAYHIYLRD